MANHLNMATVDTILTLHQQRWSIRRIAATLGIHRDTVARHLRRAKQAGAPTGTAPPPSGAQALTAPEGNLGQAPAGSAGGRVPCPVPRAGSGSPRLAPVARARLPLARDGSRR